MDEGRYEITSPVDGSVYHRGSFLNFDQAVHRVSRARKAQEEFARVEVAERADLVRRFVKAFEAHLDEWAPQVSWMMGKPLAHARGEFGGLRERALAMADLAEDALQEEPAPEKPGFRRAITHEPLGVVLDIAAWNYPWLVAINVVAPAVLAGNAVLLKHAVPTALAGQHFERAFREAGAPEGLVQDFLVDHDTVAKIFDRQLVDYVGFTGSVRGGREVYARLAKKNLIGCGLELGGKDAALVLPDANFDYCVPQIADGAFFNAGQSCCAIERVYVPKQLLADFSERLAAEIRKLNWGHPLQEGTTLGPVVNRAAVDRLEEHAADALAWGAKRLVGPDEFGSVDESNCYVCPQLFVDVSHDMLLMKEESFGPILGVMSYETEEEALGLVNDSQYGLTASLWTSDLGRARQLAARIRAGTVFANRADYVDPELPWSGVADSGLGCTLSRHGLLALTRPKSLHFKEQP